LKRGGTILSGGGGGAAAAAADGQEEDRYEVTENKELQEHLQNYFKKWVPGVSIPGPPPETFFHSVLNRRVIEEGNHGCKQADVNPEEEEEEDFDDNRMSLDVPQATFAPIEMPAITEIQPLPAAEQ